MAESLISLELNILSDEENLRSISPEDNLLQTESVALKEGDFVLEDRPCRKRSSKIKLKLGELGLSNRPRFLSKKSRVNQRIIPNGCNANKDIRSNTEEFTIECSVCFHKFTNDSVLSNHICIPSIEILTESDSSHENAELDCGLLSAGDLITHNGRRPQNNKSIPISKFSIAGNNRHGREVPEPITCDPLITGARVPKKRPYWKSRYHCSICRRKFTNSCNLARHNRIHDFTKRCTICNINFATTTKLMVHMRTHPEVRPYECRTCHKKFATPTILKAHVRTHSGERPYTCDMCNKNFTTRGILKTHGRTHTGDKFK